MTGPIHVNLLHALVNLVVVKRFLTENRFAVRAYFDWLYRRADPYELGRTEEVRKFDAAFAMLDGLQVQRALEIGCGEGRITPRIAAIAHHVLAVDISPIAINRARRIGVALRNVEFRVGDLLGMAPGGRLLLIHARARGDDVSGIDNKAFGARTIHEHLLATGRVHVEQEIITDAWQALRLRLREPPGSGGRAG